MSRYSHAALRIQTAIGTLLGFNRWYSGTQPKHLRVSIDLNRSDVDGLVKLLTSKGVFTTEEYREAVTQSAEAEATRYEVRVGNLDA